MKLRGRAVLACTGCLVAVWVAGCGQSENRETPPAGMNDTATAPSSQAADADDAADAVEDALENDTTLKPFDLDADDEGNNIVLTGKVQTQEQKALAESVAKRTAPNFTVVNRITVE